MLMLHMKESKTGETLEVYTPKDSIYLDKDRRILSFFAFTGMDQNHEATYIPYILSYDNSHQFKELAHAAWDAIRLTGNVASGAERGARDPKALRQGPNAMRAAALKGARRGLWFGLLIVAAFEIRKHVLFSQSKPKHHYVSAYGPDLDGPTFLKQGI